MMSFRRFAAFAALVACCTGAAPAADAGAQLRANVLAAMAATTSFQIDVSNPQGITGSLVVLTQAGRTKVQGSAGPHTLLVYVVNGYAYQQVDGSAWERHKVPPLNGLLLSPLAPSATVTPEADTTVGGTRYGAFAAVTSLALPGIGTIPNVMMDCTYDKTTYLLHACTSQYATFAFHDYNDPKNVVDLPAEAKNAREGAPYGTSGFPTGG